MRKCKGQKSDQQNEKVLLSDAKRLFNGGRLALARQIERNERLRKEKKGKSTDQANEKRADQLEAEGISQIFHIPFAEKLCRKNARARNKAEDRKIEDGKVVTFMEKFPLKGYFEDEVYLAPIYSHVWKAKKPVKISVELNK